MKKAAQDEPKLDLRNIDLNESGLPALLGALLVIVALALIMLMRKLS